MTIDILQTSRFIAVTQTLLEESFRTHLLPEVLAQEGGLAAVAPRIRGIATLAKYDVGEDLLRQLPALEIIASHSAEISNIDRAAAAVRNISVTNTSHVLADDVADHAFGLMIALMRDFVGADRFIREGGWQAGPFPLGRRLKHRRLGILGLGHIGSALARRAEASLMEVAYCGPRTKPDVRYRYFAEPAALADWCDVLAVTCNGGPTTRHLVNASVLAALGPEGWLVNVARGSVIDEAALVEALATGRIAGAALDVFENEPSVSPALLAAGRLLVTPHMASGTVETKSEMGRSMVDALRHRLLPGVAAP